MIAHTTRFFLRAAAIFSLGTALFAGVYQIASAQVSSGITIKPAVVEEKATPGQSYEYSLSVTNEGTSQQTYYLQTQDIKGLDDRGQPIFAAQGEQTGYELSSWITFPQKSLTLAAKETKSVVFDVYVPANASPGAHFASVILANQPEAVHANGSSVALDVGAIVSLQVPGNIVEQANIEEFSTSKLVYGTPSVDFKTKVANAGNVLVRPTGLIEVTNMFGTKMATISVNENTGATFPGSSRTYTSTWNYDGTLFGRYQAVVSLAYGDQARKTISNTTSFWVLPLGMIGTALVTVIAVIVLFSVLTKFYIRGKLRQMGVDTRADTTLYRRKYQSSSRLMVVVLSVMLVCVVFLVALFLIFA